MEDGGWRMEEKRWRITAEGEGVEEQIEGKFKRVGDFPYR